MSRDRENQCQSERLERVTPNWTQSADFHTGPRQMDGRITRPDTRKRLTTLPAPAKNPLRPTGRPHTIDTLGSAAFLDRLAALMRPRSASETARPEAESHGLSNRHHNRNRNQ